MKSLQELAWNAYLLQLPNRKPTGWASVSSEQIVTMINGKIKWDDMARRHFPGPYLWDVVVAIENYMRIPNSELCFNWVSWDENSCKKRGRLVYEEFLEHKGIFYEKYVETQEHFIKRLKNAI